MTIKKYTITDEELILLIILVAGLDPERYPHPMAKSLIYKSKVIVEDEDEIRLRVTKT